MGGGGGGGFNPFQDVSWSRPFGNSFLGNALQGNPNAPLTPEGKDKQTGEQYVMDPNQIEGGGQEYQTGSSYGMPVRDPNLIAQENETRRLEEQRKADEAGAKLMRQNEADAFTTSMGRSRSRQAMMDSMRGIQDRARKLRGRTLFGG